MITLFDGYAGRFDEHLQDKLGYRVPQLVLEALRATGPAKPLDILDLGCGTGLCGVLLRPLAASLTGVDLSSAMVEKSRSRGIYDRLVVSDLASFLRGAGRDYDLLVAADVVIYVGDLLLLFQAAARVIRPGGLFIFSVEACGGERFQLQPTQRFAHSRPYLERITTITGMELRSCEPILIRIEAGQPVRGYLAIAGMPEYQSGQ